MLNEGWESSDKKVEKGKELIHKEKKNEELIHSQGQVTAIHLSLNNFALLWTKHFYRQRNQRKIITDRK